MTHSVIFEPDSVCRSLVERALASIFWTFAAADSFDQVADLLPGPWAAVLAVESGDVHALHLIGEMRQTAPATALCVLVDELSPDFDRALYVAGVDAVFAKPVQEREIAEALVAGFMARRS